MWAAVDFVNGCRIHPSESSPARSSAMPCIGISRAGAGGSTRLSIATSLWPAPLRCTGERWAGICCGPGQFVSRGAGARRQAHGRGGAAGRHGAGGGMACGPPAPPRDRGRARDRAAGGNRTARNTVPTAGSVRCGTACFRRPPGPGLLAATTAGVFLGGAMLAAFSRVVTDPLQRRMGLHRRRLEWLLRVLEADLLGEPGRNRLMRDHYVARLVDIFDLIALAMRVSHA